MRNSNYLEGMQCPQCESFGPFEIQITTVSEVHDEGIERNYDSEWDEDSYCRCMQSDCGKSATVEEFTIKKDGAV